MNERAMIWKDGRGLTNNSFSVCFGVLEELLRGLLEGSKVALVVIKLGIGRR